MSLFCLCPLCSALCLSLHEKMDVWLEDSVNCMSLNVWELVALHTTAFFLKSWGSASFALRRAVSSSVGLVPGRLHYRIGYRTPLVKPHYCRPFK